MSVQEASVVYTATHEWIRGDAPGELTVGVSAHAQDLLGDLVFVSLPDVGTHFEVGEDVVVLESVKTAADVYAPVSGTITSVNEAVLAEPALVNQAPLEAGWLFKIKTEAPLPEGLMAASDYASQHDV